jgi:outer membrane protein assembly factor BamB
LWTYTAENVGVESPYGNYPVGIACIADEKLYLTTSEHSVTSPLFRGSYIRCIYADNGTEIWKVQHWSDGTPGVAGSGLYIADGFLVSLNFYDNKLYCYGKGPSATTISAPDTVQPLNTPVLIKGTVTDTAAGSEQEEQAARFPDGVPAVSDDNMQAWMEYVYMQQQKPTDVKGVDVVVSVIDPNNNFYEVGRTTSDSNGMYKLMFTPEVPGEYTVVARFEGSNSYYASQAQTALGVIEVSQPTTQPTPVATESIADMYFVPAVIGIILANLAIGIMVILLLRKRQ